MNTWMNLATACLASVALYGCAAHTYQLISDEESGKAVGLFARDGGEPRISLEFGGKKFAASGFAVTRSQNLSELRRQYGSYSKHYANVFSGLDSRHYVYSANPELRSDDGQRLRCVFAWRLAKALAGTCTTSDGKQVEIRSG